MVLSVCCVLVVYDVCAMCAYVARCIFGPECSLVSVGGTSEVMATEISNAARLGTISSFTLFIMRVPLRSNSVLYYCCWLTPTDRPTDRPTDEGPPTKARSSVSSAVAPAAAQPGAGAERQNPVCLLGATLTLARNVS